MAYAELEDVQLEFKNVTFGASTYPSADAVESFITQTDALINAKLGLVYQVPVEEADDDSTDEALALLKMICVGIVAARVKEILRVKTGDPKADQESRGGNLGVDARKLLDEIVAGKVKLIGVSKIDSKDGVTSYAAANGIEPVFTRAGGTGTREDEQW